MILMLICIAIYLLMLVLNFKYYFGKRMKRYIVINGLLIFSTSLFLVLYIVNEKNFYGANLFIIYFMFLGLVLGFLYALLLLEFGEEKGNRSSAIAIFIIIFCCFSFCSAQSHYRNVKNIRVAFEDYNEFSQYISVDSNFPKTMPLYVVDSTVSFQGYSAERNNFPLLMMAINKNPEKMVNFYGFYDLDYPYSVHVVIRSFEQSWEDFYENNIVLDTLWQREQAYIDFDTQNKEISLNYYDGICYKIKVTPLNIETFDETMFEGIKNNLIGVYTKVF